MWTKEFSQTMRNMSWLIRRKRDGEEFVGEPQETQEGWLFAEVYNNAEGIAGRLYIIENGSLMATYRLSGASTDVWRMRVFQ